MVYTGMKNIYVSCCILLSSLGTASAQNKEIMKQNPTVLTCKLTTPEMQKRKATAIAELKSWVLQTIELNNGFQYKFSATDSVLNALTEFIKSERMCCDFFVFQLTVEKENAMLSLTGQEGAKEFIKYEVGL